MNKQIISLICLLMLSSGLNGMDGANSGAGAGLKGGDDAVVDRPRARSADDVRRREELRVGSEVAAHMARQPQPAGDGAGALTLGIGKTATASGTERSVRGPQAQRREPTAEENLYSAESGDDQDLAQSALRGSRLTASDLARGQSNMHQSLANVILLGKTSFTVNSRHCSRQENETARFALEQLATLERLHTESRTTTHEADLGNLIRTLSTFPESQETVLRAIERNPGNYSQLLLPFVGEIKRQLETGHFAAVPEEEHGNRMKSLLELRDRLFRLYGGELLDQEETIETVFNNNADNFKGRIQAKETWFRRNWGKFAAGAAAFGFVARPYVESGVKYVARVGLRVTAQQLLDKYHGGDSSTTDASTTPVTPPTE